MNPFMINLNRYKEIEIRAAGASVEGVYHLAAVKPGFGVTRRAVVPNLITDLGLNNLATNIPMFYVAQLGTGTAPPDPEDTGLGNFGVAITGQLTGTHGNSGAPDYFSWARYSFTSAVGGATGNWTEIGMSDSESPGGLNSRALIVDNLGNPTAFPVQADEALQGAYEIRVYPPLGDNVSEVNIGSTTYDAVSRALSVNVSSVWAKHAGFKYFEFQGGNNVNFWYSGGLGAITETAPQGSVVAGTNNPGVTNHSYSQGSFERQASFRWGGGISGVFRTALLRCGLGEVQVEYDPTITKTADEELIINQVVSWARR